MRAAEDDSGNWLRAAATVIVADQSGNVGANTVVDGACSALDRCSQAGTAELTNSRRRKALLSGELGDCPRISAAGAGADGCEHGGGSGLCIGTQRVNCAAAAGFDDA